MTDILFNVQEAMLGALSASADVQALLGSPVRVYDHVPDDAVFPYVAFGPANVTPYDNLTDVGFEQVITLNIWSRYRGGKETRDIFQSIYDTLHRASLTIDGQTFVSCDFHSADFSLDSDGLTYFCAARFSLVTQSQ
jgi:hypothetical protein